MTCLNDVLTSKQHRKLPGHVKDILNYIVNLNLADIRLDYNCHYKISWIANGRRCSVSFSGTPKNDAHMLKIVKRDIRREMGRV